MGCHYFKEYINCPWADRSSKGNAVFKRTFRHFGDYGDGELSFGLLQQIQLCAPVIQRIRLSAGHSSAEDADIVLGTSEAYDGGRGGAV